MQPNVRNKRLVILCSSKRESKISLCMAMKQSPIYCYEHRHPINTHPSRIKAKKMGFLSGSVGGVSDFSSGHDLTTLGCEPCVGLSPISRAGFGFSVPPDLCPYTACVHTLARSFSLKNKQKKNKNKMQLIF